MLIVEDPTVCRTAVKVLFSCFGLCLSAVLDSLSHVHLSPYPFLLTGNHLNIN